jgi:hypothetical protein
MPPSDYVNTYLQLVSYVDDVSAPFKTPVRNYLQSGLGAQATRAQKAYDHLLAALPKVANLPKGKSLPPVFQVEGWDYMRTSLWRAYNGKGAPNEIQDAIYLAGLCNFVNSGSLLTYVDQNLGIDCGGFVANYWGMGRPDYTTPNPLGATGFKPRTIWGMYPNLRRKTAGEIKEGDAAIFFSGVKNDDPNIAATAKAGGGYVDGSGSKAFHIGLVNSITATTGASEATLQIAESSGATSTFSHGNGVNVRDTAKVQLKVANHLVYCPSGNNRIYFVGRPVYAPAYAANPWGE